MSTIIDYVNELEYQRDLLADILTEKGIEASKSEKFNTLIPKVRDISGGGGLAFDMSGIFGLFTSDSIDIANNLWKNEISGYNDIELTGGSKNGESMHFNSNEYGKLKCAEPNTVYAVVKTNSSTGCKCIITKYVTQSSPGCRTYGFNLLEQLNCLFFSGAYLDIGSTTAPDSTEYHVYCYTRDGEKVYYYIDGTLIGEIDGCKSRLYGNYMYLNNENFGGSIYDSPTNCDFLMCGFGLAYHDESLIQKNTAYLIQKYGINTVE